MNRTVLHQVIYAATFICATPWRLYRKPWRLYKKPWRLRRKLWRLGEALWRHNQYSRRVCLKVFVAGALSLGLTVHAEEFSQGPDVTIIAGEDKVVYEFRQNGHLRMVRVVPTWGKPYYLVPRDNTKGFGDLQRADMLLPQWVIAEF